MSTRDYLKGRGEAHEIEKRLNVAYYLAAEGKTDSAEYHYAFALKEFYDLASAFGFKVERIAAPATEAA